MTPGQQAFADGFAANLATHGQTWTRTSDSAPIPALPTSPKIETPHLAYSQDRELAVLVADRSLMPPLTAAQVMPVTRLKKADELTKGTKKYRVVRADFRETTATWLVILSPTF